MVTARATTDEMGNELWGDISMAGIRPATTEFHTGAPTDDEYEASRDTHVGHLLGGTDDLVGRQLIQMGASAHDPVLVSRARNARRSRYEWKDVLVFRMGNKIQVVS